MVKKLLFLSLSVPSLVYTTYDLSISLSDLADLPQRTIDDVQQSNQRGVAFDQNDENKIEEYPYDLSTNLSQKPVYSIKYSNQARANKKIQEFVKSRKKDTHQVEKIVREGMNDTLENKLQEHERQIASKKYKKIMVCSCITVVLLIACYAIVEAVT